MRFTEKWKDKYDLVGESDDNVELFIKNCGEILDKFGQLEDIEDELELDLVTFIRCLKLLDRDEFVYVYRSDDLIYSAITPVQFLVDVTNKEFIELRREKGYEQHLKFKDYGKTWALTKEELL